MSENPKKAKPQQKKKPSRVVSSRYMQAAADVSKMAKTNTATADETKFFGNTGMRSKMMSTPKVSHFNVESCDASAIHPDISHFPETKPVFARDDDKLKTNLKFPSNRDQTKISGARVRICSGSREEADDEQDREAEVDLLYAKYLQALFVKTQLLKTTEARVSNAMVEQHKLFIETGILMQQVNEAHKNLTKIQCAKRLMELCEKDREVLQPVLAVLHGAIEQYGEVANALEKTSNHLLTSNVEISPTSQSDVIHLLQKCNALFQEASTTIEAEEVSVMSQLLSKIVDLLHKTCSEIRRFLDSVSQADALAEINCSLCIR